MKRAYWYGIILFIIGLLIEISPPIIFPFYYGDITMFFHGDSYIIGFYSLLPIFWDHIITIFLMPVAILTGGILGGFIIAPLYLVVHKLIYRRTRFYGFLKNQTHPSIARWLRRGILPTLFAVYGYMTVSSIIVNFPDLGILQLIIAPELLAHVTNPTELEHILWGFTGIFASFATIFLVAPTWFLDDAGLLTANIELTSSLQSKHGDLPNITGVGTWLARLLKGYAGISVILLYAQQMFQAYIIGLLSPEIDLLQLITNMTMFALFPILLLLFSLPTLMIIEKLFQHRQHYIHKLGDHLGITAHYDFNDSGES